MQRCRVVTTGPVQLKQCVKWDKVLNCLNKCSLQGSLEVHNGFCPKGNVLILVKPVAKLPFSQMPPLTTAEKRTSGISSLLETGVNFCYCAEDHLAPTFSSYT